MTLTREEVSAGGQILSARSADSEIVAITKCFEANVPCPMRTPFKEE